MFGEWDFPSFFNFRYNVTQQRIKPPEQAVQTGRQVRFIFANLDAYLRNTRAKRTGGASHSKIAVLFTENLR